MKEQQCRNCGNFNLLSRHTCEYCGSPDLKVIETSTKEVDMTVDQFLEEFGALGPAFLQCGKVTGFIKDGVTLCGKPMMHEGEC